MWGCRLISDLFCQPRGRILECKLRVIKRDLIGMQRGNPTLSATPLSLRTSAHLTPICIMEALGATGSIISILELSTKIAGYIISVKNAPKELEKCALEAANFNNLLTNLRYRLGSKDSRDPWHTSVRALGIENGPLEQFKKALEELQAGFVDEGILKKIGGERGEKIGVALKWKLKKEEVASILSRMERLNALVQIALEMDHMFVLVGAFEDPNAYVLKKIIASY